MSSVIYSTGADNTISHVYIAIPDGPRVKGRVKLVLGTDELAETTHPGKRHRWHEMLHYGERGTGFAQCYCGAIGVLYERPV